MKYIVIGLGSFGTKIAEILTEMGNEVIGVDQDLSKVELLKEKISHTIALDATDENAVNNLPLKDTDVVVICIGEDEGASLMATALMKKHNPKRLISRAVNPLQETILEAMGITEIVHPEEEAANRWAKKLNFKGVMESYEVTGDYNLVEVKVPEKFVGKTLKEINLREKYDLLVLSTISSEEKKNVLGKSQKVEKIREVASGDTMLFKEDIMVLYGYILDIKKFLKEE
ncbi:MAG TPA: TrkA family potassium uptake protein [Salinimicrobium sp.]|nr:TrkA family potassium uptake protein [Salinimicrobium sp.]